MPRTRRPERRYHHGALRQALLDAALALLQHEGPAELTLRAVARRAGVSHMAPYHHFRDRAALVAAVSQHGFEELERFVREQAIRAGDPLRGFQAAAVAYVVFGVRNPALYRVMFGPEVCRMNDYPDLQRSARAAFALIGEGADRCRTQGLLRDTLGPETAALIWASLHGLVMLLLDGQLSVEARPEEAAMRLATAATDLLYEGLRGRPEAGPPPPAT